MTKYNFGEDIKPGSTMEWAFQNVKSNSRVLEWGPAVGTLTKHLQQDKQCQVDIVEIDAEAGRRAAQYACKSFLGEKEGNLESLYWYNELKQERYDYIIILDVLEHLRNAAALLEHVGELLKDEGVLLLSVPNIAHNSVIINLLNNRFVYTDVGLLDETHVHFYTHDSLCQILEAAGLYPFEKDAIQLRVGENELSCNYSDVPPAIEAFLRTRDYGDVYQFLFKIRKKKRFDNPVSMEKENLPYTLYQMEAMDERGIRVFHKFVNPKLRFEERIKVPEKSATLRLDLLNSYCIIRDLSIIGITERGQIPLIPGKTNMMQVGEYWYSLNQNPQIFIEGQTGGTEILIRGEFVSFGDDALKFMLPVWEKLAYQKSQFDDLSNQQTQLYDYIEKKEQYVQELLTTIRQKDKELQELQNRIAGK